MCSYFFGSSQLFVIRRCLLHWCEQQLAGTRQRSVLISVHGDQLLHLESCCFESTSSFHYFQVFFSFERLSLPDRFGYPCGEAHTVRSRCLLADSVYHFLPWRGFLSRQLLSRGFIYCKTTGSCLQDLPFPEATYEQFFIFPLTHFPVSSNSNQSKPRTRVDQETVEIHSYFFLCQYI